MLYEVITGGIANDGVGDVGQVAAQLRITSYNVCYTKLLRLLNEFFVLRGTHIDVLEPDLFATNPAAMLELFYQVAEHPEITGIYSACLRYLRDARRRLAHPRAPRSVARTATRRARARAPGGRGAGRRLPGAARRRRCPDGSRRR